MSSFRRLVPRLTRAQRDVAVELLRRVYETADSIRPRQLEKAHDRDSQTPMGFGRLLESRYQVFLIEGQRGAGKSTVLRWLQCATPFLGSRNFRRQEPDGREDESGAHLDDTLDALLKDERLPSDLLRAHESANDRESPWMTALCLPAIDPGRREPNDAPMMEQILALLDNFLSDRLPVPETPPRPVETEEWRFAPRREGRVAQDYRAAADLRTTLREVVFRGWVFSQASGQRVISQDVAGIDDYVVARAEEAGKAARRHQTWHDFVDRLLNTYRCRLLVLFFDDCDLTPDIIDDLLETIRLYLDHPRIVVLVAGNLDAIRNNLRVAGLDRLAGVAPTFEAVVDYQNRLHQSMGALASGTSAGVQNAFHDFHDATRTAKAGIGRSDRLVDTYIDLVMNRLDEADRYIGKLLRAGQQFTLHPPALDEATDFVFAPFLLGGPDRPRDGKVAVAAIAVRIRQELQRSSTEENAATGGGARRLGVACDAFLWLLWRRDVSIGLSLRVLAEVRDHFKEGFRSSAPVGMRKPLASMLPRLLEDDKADETARRVLEGNERIDVQLRCGREAFASGSVDDLLFVISAEDRFVEERRTTLSDPAARRKRAYSFLLLDQARVESLTRRIAVEVVWAGQAALPQGAAVDPSTQTSFPHASAESPFDAPAQATRDGIILRGETRHPVESIRICAGELQAALGGRRRGSARGIDAYLIRMLERFSPAAGPSPPTNAYLMAHLANLGLHLARAPSLGGFESRDLTTLVGAAQTQMAKAPQQDLSEGGLSTLLAGMPPQARPSPLNVRERLRRYGQVWSVVQGNETLAGAVPGSGSDLAGDPAMDDPSVAFARQLEAAITQALAYRQSLVQTVDMALYTAGAVLASEGGPWLGRRGDGDDGRSRVSWAEFRVPALGDAVPVGDAVEALGRRLATIAEVLAERREETLHRALPLHLLVAVLLPLACLRRLGVEEAAACLEATTGLWQSDADWGLEPTVAVGQALLAAERDASTGDLSSLTPRGTQHLSYDESLRILGETLKQLAGEGLAARFGIGLGLDEKRLGTVSDILVLDRDVTALAAVRLPALRDFLQSKPVEVTANVPRRRPPPKLPRQP